MEDTKIKFVEAASEEELEKEVRAEADFYPGYIVTNVSKLHITMGKFNGFVAKLEYSKI